MIDDAIVPCRVRGGLPFLREKLADPQRTVRVAYFGGSITEAPGYRVQSLAWMNAAFPANVVEINAGIGGTGSDLGVFRVEDDVIAKKPDLVIVEFAVNDTRAPRQQIRRCAEGIVRKIRRAVPDCALLFVYTLTEYMIDQSKLADKPIDDWVNLLNGKLFPSMVAHEEIAAHYGIPTLVFADPVLRLMRKGQLVFTVPEKDKDACIREGKVPFTPDAVHPYHDVGHRVYTDAIVRHFGELLAAGASTVQALPMPYDAHNWEHARFISPVEGTRTGAWKELTQTEDKPHCWQALPTIWQGSTDAAITFQFSGTAIGVMDVIGPRAGNLLVSIDGAAPRSIGRFDAYCTYNRKHSVIVADALAQGNHTVTFTVDPTVPDKAAILAKREAVTPEAPDVVEWHFIQLMVVWTQKLFNGIRKLFAEQVIPFSSVMT